MSFSQVSGKKNPDNEDKDNEYQRQPEKRIHENSVFHDLFSLVQCFFRQTIS